MSQYSSVRAVTGHGIYNRTSQSPQGHKFFHPNWVQTDSGPHPVCYLPRALSKLPEGVPDHSLSSIFDIKNRWSFAFSHP